MTVAELYRSYRRKLKEDPEYDLWMCEYLFDGKRVTKVTKRVDYYIHTTDNVYRVAAQERVQ
jgi:hypothetical protein